MIYRPVLTKQDFTVRYLAGEFGNHSPTWNTYEEWLAGMQPPGTLYHLRNRVAGGPTYYNLDWMKLSAVWYYRKCYLRPHNWYISEMAPTSETVIQGEAARVPGGIYFYYSTVVAPMRDALQQQAHSACGILALTLLRRYLCPNSLDWLFELFDRYPDHVVEFSTYAHNWGTLPNFNTVFWEVRLY